MIRSQLLTLVAAGVLSEMTFSFHDADSVCGVTVSFDAYTIEDFVEVDLSRLRLVASTTCTGSLEIACLGSAVTEVYTRSEWLPPTHPNLAWYQVQQNECVENSDLLGEEQ